MSKKKIKIHEFNPTIYPRKLWVCKGVNALSVIKGNFIDSNGSEILFEDKDVSGFEAITMNVINKNNSQCGVLVWIRTKKDISTIAHESVHCASFIFDDFRMAMGFSGGQDEHFAYLVGFCADCINQVVKNKFKE